MISVLPEYDENTGIIPHYCLEISKLAPRVYHRTWSEGFASLLSSKCRHITCEKDTRYLKKLNEMQDATNH